MKQLLILFILSIPLSAKAVNWSFIGLDIGNSSFKADKISGGGLTLGSSFEIQTNAEHKHRMSINYLSVKNASGGNQFADVTY